MKELGRRDFLRHSTAAAGGIFLTGQSPALSRAETSPQRVLTVTGEVSAEELGSMLPHEHVMSLFGAEITENATYDEPHLMETVVPYLARLKRLGCGTIADCTTAYFGRRPDLLKRICELTKIQILTNTGYYAAANDRYVPRHAYQESAERIARRWIREWEDGIGDTGIRPGFIKIGIDGGPISEIDAKLVRAAALTHLETGLVIAAHTGANPDVADAQLKILYEENVHPSAWIWVHANNLEQGDDFLRIADSGGWIELDAIDEDSSENHVKMVEAFKERNLLDRLLLSHDGNSFRYGNRPAKPYHGLYTTFIPFLKKKGYSSQEINLLTRRNPAAAFSVGIRKV